jgi:uncharacterized membrane protein
MIFEILTAVVVLIESFSLVFSTQIRDFHDLHWERPYSLFFVVGTEHVCAPQSYAVPFSQCSCVH